MSAGGKYYFISDVHLGVSGCDRQELEARFVSLLDSIGPDAGGVFLLGDIFDFWYEYRYVIPRGHTRALGALARLTDKGVPVWFFPGNHDVGLLLFCPGAGRTGHTGDAICHGALRTPLLPGARRRARAYRHGVQVHKVDVPQPRAPGTFLVHSSQMGLWSWLCLGFAFQKNKE